MIIKNCIIDKQDAIEKLVNSGCWKSCKIRIEMVDGVVGASINDMSITVDENINTTNIVIFNFLYIRGNIKKVQLVKSENFFDFAKQKYSLVFRLFKNPIDINKKKGVSLSIKPNIKKRP